MVQAHHLQWLSGIPELVSQSEREGLNEQRKKELLGARQSCEAVLRQDPAMPDALSLRDRIASLLNGETSPAPRETSGNPDIPTEESIAALDRLIPEIEEGMRAIASRTLQSSSGQYPYEVPNLGVSFNIIRDNQKNPLKNGLKLVRDYHQGNLQRYESAMGHFAYAFNADEPGGVVGATYSPNSNYISVPRDFEPHCTLKLFDMYHEVLHALQHIQLRMRIGDEAYRDFYRPDSQVTIFPFELEANILHTEAIDRYLGGWIRKNIQHPVTPERETEFMQKMQASERYRVQARSILQGAQRYFPQGCRDDRCAPAFAESIRRAYSDRPLFTFAPDGRILRM